MIEASKNELGELHGPACFTYSENSSIIYGRFQAGQPIGFWVSVLIATDDNGWALVKDGENLKFVRVGKVLKQVRDKQKPLAELPRA